MNRIILSAHLILEAASAGRLSMGVLGVQLDGQYVDDHGGQQVVELIDAGCLVLDGERISVDLSAALTFVQDRP